MKLSVMQPYIFPYLGYYQLIKNSDVFVIYDDANYIKQGYINRNNILAKDNPQRFTIPVPKSSSNKKIKDLSYSNEVDKFLQTIKQSYRNAPYFSDVFPIIEKIIGFGNRSISAVCLNEYVTVFDYLRCPVNIIKSSELEYDRSLSASDKLIDMANNLDCEEYVNSYGGISLYDKEYFSANNIKLSFLKMNEISYSQNNKGFVPNLSIIDVLMWNSPEEIINFLGEVEVL
ncbi:WbqC family protein [Vibrio parahaemolyticus]|nr:WbqC family protein [Vibrio parahaemolyticus]HCG5273792.1 WbqC family protein [Vibrio parahaemolyticus]HCG5507990.1 WbqC family protein [Vibrio parahaemolyticus]